jgi:hypothetical protein
VTPTVTGMGIAAVLVLSWIGFGFGAFVLVVVAMAIGALIGRIVEGKLDVSSLLDVFRGKRSSS